VLSLLEYVEHLKDEAQVCAIIERVQRYLEEKGTTEEICRIYLRRILHTYYKFDYKAHQRQLTPPEGSSKVRSSLERALPWLPVRKQRQVSSQKLPELEQRGNPWD
jgi:hypothetical protein